MAIPDSVTSIGTSAFGDCSSLTSITVDKNNVNYSSDECGVLFNKDKTTLIQYPIGNIRTSYLMPSTLTNIANYAFEYCTNLTSVTIPNSVTSIGDYAFIEFTGLTSIKIPASVTSVGDYAFGDCSNLTNVTIPASVTSIAEGAFYDCTALTDIYYAKSEEDWEKIVIETGYNEPLFSATVHYNCIPECAEHTLGEWIITTTPTCIEGGEETRYCSVCNYSETQYVEVLEHTIVPIEAVSPTCTETGLTEGSYCEACGKVFREQTIVEAVGHSMGEWITVTEADYNINGVKKRICSQCIYTETAEIEALGKRIENENGIVVDIPGVDPDDAYTINVDNVLDEELYFKISDITNGGSYIIYDITLTLNGEPVQPDGYVTVKIPLPKGYDESKTLVYYIEMIDGVPQMTDMKAKCENGYLIFQTDHFSYYGVLEINEENETKINLEISTPSTTTINYGDSIVLHANVDLPEGAKVIWKDDNGNFSKSVSADGMTCTITPVSNGDTTFTAYVVDANGNQISDPILKQ